MITHSQSVRFSRDEAQAASDVWGFNCGPAALCAILDMMPLEIRPHMGDFESKGYTNPRLMAWILRGMSVQFRRVFEDLGTDAGKREPVFPGYGLVRVQWSGPWTRPGVPLRVRYRHTHWVAMRGEDAERSVFDINAICVGGWLPWEEWSGQLVPWLIEQVEPEGDGRWWPTHCWHLDEPRAERKRR